MPLSRRASTYTYTDERAYTLGGESSISGTDVQASLRFETSIKFLSKKRCYESKKVSTPTLHILVSLAKSTYAHGGRPAHSGRRSTWIRGGEVRRTGTMEVAVEEHIQNGNPSLQVEGRSLVGETLQDPRAIRTSVKRRVKGKKGMASILLKLSVTSFHNNKPESTAFYNQHLSQSLDTTTIALLFCPDSH